MPSELSEDEVLIAVTPVDGQEIVAEELLDFLAGRLPRFMVPRYVRILESLPKTSSGKIQKHILRSEGVTGNTVDRELKRAS